jgi:hypothetical protein
LQETHGTWTDSPGALDVFWERCDTVGGNCAQIVQTAGQTYTLTQIDAGHTIRAVEGASNSNGTGTAAESAPTAVIVVPAAPTNSSPPTIAGMAGIGRTLSDMHGSWSAHPTSYRYQWLDCDSMGNACAVIAGATAQTYKITTADVGHRIRVAEYSVNAGGTSSPATSAATAIVPVAPGTTGTGTLGRPTVRATSVRVPVSCTGGFGAICQLKLTLTVIETIRGGKPVAVAAARRAVKRTVVLAAASTSLSAPQSTTVGHTLGPVGKLLLATFHLLHARVSATEGTQVMWNATIMFKTKAKPKRR